MLLHLDPKHFSRIGMYRYLKSDTYGYLIIKIPPAYTLINKKRLAFIGCYCAFEI
ncbi:hypothetical protein VV208B2_46480 (plasmid) [Vibrio vulnificus]|nr:hypothetical protein VV208B2_46480 [Vibrio vulnificus]BDP38542.1 hypothetical protein VA208B3_49130 [Vibrio alginolyticus]